MESSVRPWGGYEVIYKTDGVQVKRIEVKPRSRCSLQRHLKRSEKWIVIRGAGVVTLGQKEMTVRKGSTIDVPQGEVHRIHNTADEPLVFIEIQFGDYLGEDDIIRLADDFGRA